MEYYAHTREDGERQTVKAHLEGVSKLAEGFSVDFLKPLAKKAAFDHDLGKYALKYQWRLDDDNIKFSHAACGALEYKKFADKNDCSASLFCTPYGCIASQDTTQDLWTAAQTQTTPIAQP